MHASHFRSLLSMRALSPLISLPALTPLFSVSVRSLSPSLSIHAMCIACSLYGSLSAQLMNNTLGLLFDVHTQMSPPATRESVQWADHQDSRNFDMPASDEHWQPGDLDVRPAKPRTLKRKPSLKLEMIAMAKHFVSL